MTFVWGSPPARETVSAAAYRQLKEALLRGQIPMGARIHELELAASWRVSRTPIRDALRRLEAEGLVHAVPRRGVVVPRLSLAEAEELYEIREVLETRAARRAAERATPEFDARLNTMIRQFGTALKAGDTEQMVVIDRDCHASIAEVGGNTRLARAIDALRAQLQVVSARGFAGKGRAARSFREMAKLITAIRARDPARAETAMREHITSLREDLVHVFHELEL